MARYFISIISFGRQALTGACFSYLQRQLERLQLDAAVVVTDSQESVKAQTPGSFYYFNTENRPLSNKTQENLKKIRELSSQESRGVIKLDTDDFLSDRQLLACCSMLEEGLTGQFDYLYVYDLPRERLTCNYKVTPFGAGRVFSAQALEAMDWQVYTPGLSKGLDRNATEKLEAAGVEFNVFTCSPGEIILDIKAGSPLDITDPLNYRGQQVEPELVLRHFDKQAQQDIQAIKESIYAIP